MVTFDPTTVVIVSAGDVLGTSNGVQITQLTAQNPRVQVTDSSTFVFYTVTQGAAPSEIWMDAVDGGAGAATASSVTGLVGTGYTASPGQLVLVSTQSSPATITLPSATNIVGQRVSVKDASGSASTNNITVSASNSQRIDGSSSVSISTSYGSVTVVSDGSNWWTIA
jgi:hypothetical protein